MEEILVTTKWLASNIDNPDTFVIEVNAKPSKINEHIPGALVWDLHKTFEDSHSLDVINQFQFKDLMDKNGISNTSTIVLYGDGDNRSATFAFWVFKYHKHDTVKILDGSIKKWKHDGNEINIINDNLSTKKIKNKSEYKAKTPDFSIRITKDEILENI